MLFRSSGIRWGLGSDATAVTTSNPFYTLSFAVTGKMIGGRKVNRQSVTREEALIAHTRSNAAIVFQENNLGSIQNGKYADLLVLDRDYMTVPADQIKDIQPLMTMVGVLCRPMSSPSCKSFWRASSVSGSLRQVAKAA